jgi:hypothetical protein
LTTNRDRIAEWGSKAKIAVGKILYHAMRDEVAAMNPFAVEDVKARNKDLEPLELLKLTLQELNCPVSFEVVRCLCDDIQKPPTAKLTTVVESLIEYAEKSEPNEVSTISKDNEIALFVATQIFAGFEVVKTAHEFQLLTTLIDLAQDRPDEEDLRALKNPILIRGPPRVSLLFVNSSVIGRESILHFLERECDRVGPWTPKDLSLTEEFNDICILADDDDEEEEKEEDEEKSERAAKMSVFVLDLPVILFPNGESEYLEGSEYLVLCSDSQSERENAHLVDEVATLVLMQTRNPEYNKRALRRKIEEKNAQAAAAAELAEKVRLAALEATASAAAAAAAAVAPRTTPTRAPPVSSRENFIYPAYGSSSASSITVQRDEEEGVDQGGDDNDNDTDSVGMDFQDCAEDKEKDQAEKDKEKEEEECSFLRRAVLGLARAAKVSDQELAGLISSVKAASSTTQQTAAEEVNENNKRTRASLVSTATTSSDNDDVDEEEEEEEIKIEGEVSAAEALAASETVTAFLRGLGRGVKKEEEGEESKEEAVGEKKGKAMAVKKQKK